MGAWVKTGNIRGPLGGTFPDAPPDGTTYGRKDTAWEPVALPADLAAEEAARIAADSALATDIDTEEAARIAADNALVTGKVNKGGDTMTGPLVLPGPPTASLEAATKGYVDSKTFDLHGLPLKATPVPADEVLLADSAGGWALVKSTIGGLTTYFNTVYATIAGFAASMTANFSAAINGMTLATILADADHLIFRRDSSATAFKITWATVKEAVRNYILGVANNVFTGNIGIQNAAPTLKLLDTDAAQGQYWLHVNGNSFYILADRDSDGTHEAPYPMRLDDATDTGYMFDQKVWTAGNDGTGSGLDADLLRGLAPTSAATGSTIVSRDGSGDFTTRLIRQEYASANGDSAYFIGQRAVGSGVDNYLRPMTVAQAKALLGIRSGYTSANQTITAAGALTLAHGLGAKPTLVSASLVCVIAELGYAVGDEVMINSALNDDGSNRRGLSLVPDATTISVRYGSGASSVVLTIIRADTGDRAPITSANWRLVVRAWVLG